MTLEEKQQLLRVSVANGLHIPLKADQFIATYWWDILNDVIFDGYLIEPERFVFKKFHNENGWCLPYRRNNRKNRRVRIGVSTIVCTLYDFLCILVHEMVHQWEWQHIGVWEDEHTVMHGKDFYSWRDTIAERSGLPLSKLYGIQTHETFSSKTMTCVT